MCTSQNFFASSKGDSQNCMTRRVTFLFLPKIFFFKSSSKTESFSFSLLFFENYFIKILIHFFQLTFSCTHFLNTLTKYEGSVGLTEQN